MHPQPRARTSLQQVRSFLVEQDAAPPAWSSGAAALEALYALLRERRDDPQFWTALEALLVRLEDGQRRPDLVAGAETLDGPSMGELLEALRDALPPRPEASDGVRSWASGLGGRALAAFLLLGTAVGCPPVRPASTDCVDADGLGLSEPSREVLCELVDIVEASSVSDATQDELIDCLRGITSSRREELLSTFRDLSGDALADALEDFALSDECEEAIGDDDDDDDDDDDH